MREIEYLAVDEQKWINELTEEALRDLLKTYRLKKYREKKGLLPKEK